MEVEGPAVSTSDEACVNDGSVESVLVEAGGKY